MAILHAALLFSAASAGDLGAPIDLSGFGQMGSILDATDSLLPESAVPIAPVAAANESPASRIYVNGIVGASFATINNGGSFRFAENSVDQSGSVNETIFTGGGALGMAIARPSGLLRMEVEGRARGPMTGQSALSIEGEVVSKLDATATNGWSTLVNFWRDYFVTDAMGIYAGGGFGVGGYHYSLATSPGADFLPLSGSSTVTTFAWQIGTGVVYEINDRITLDTGYRFFSMTPDSTTLYLPNSFGFGTYTSAFSASELLLSVRIYEPFRSWR